MSVQPGKRIIKLTLLIPLQEGLSHCFMKELAFITHKLILQVQKKNYKHLCKYDSIVSVSINNFKAVVIGQQIQCHTALRKNFVNADLSTVDNM